MPAKSLYSQKKVLSDKVMHVKNIQLITDKSPWL